MKVLQSVAAVRTYVTKMTRKAALRCIYLNIHIYIFNDGANNGTTSTFLIQKAICCSNCKNVTKTVWTCESRTLHKNSIDAL